MPIGTIESLDLEGRGVLHHEGKTIFVDAALPGETVEFSVYRRKPTFEKAQISRLIRASAQRVAPRCPWYGHCGGCSMQHFDARAQLAAKQRALEDAFWHIARLRPEYLLPSISGADWGYRTRARLSVRLVPKKGGMLVGFHERRSSYIADMKSCEILPPAISALLPALRQLTGALSIAERLPQIEVSVAENTTVLVFRNLEPITAADDALFAEFARTHGVQVWLQPAGVDSVYRLHPQDAPALQYSLPEFGVTLEFRPNDFTQVNVGVNQMLMRRAMQLLAPQPGEHVGDLFCGLGNFSLPIARRGARVTGLEGSEALTARAMENARKNGLAERCTFHAVNLFEASEDSLAACGTFDRLLIDPPREGAIAVVKALGGQVRPRRIVYVSCNPATLARDAAVLVHEKGYRLVCAGAANMFPHTSHVESIALFTLREEAR